MEVITIESEAFKEMKNDIAEIANAIRIFKEPVSEKKWLNSIEVCNILNISSRTLHRMKNGGELKYSLVGKRIMFSANEIERYLRKHE